MPRTEIFVAGEDVSVVTTANEERDFLDTFAEAYVGLIDTVNGTKSRLALEAGFDIVAKLRGYKSTVRERTVLAAGRWPHPGEEAVATAGDGGFAPSEEPLPIEGAGDGEG